MNPPSAEPETKPPCTDCGKPSTGTIYEHSQVSGDRRYLCVDCLEEDTDDLFRPLCYHCRGSGRQWDEDCEYCDGSGLE